MSAILSNTATPKYYGRFREAVMRGEIPICREIEMEMNRIDALIANPGVYYDALAVEGYIKYCENELTLTGREKTREYLQTIGALLGIGVSALTIYKLIQRKNNNNK